MADERQPFGMRRGVYAVVVVAALCGGNQALALVEADGFDGRAGGFSQVSYAHAVPLMFKQGLTLHRLQGFQCNLSNEGFHREPL
jgi:hypothetical protein